MRTSAPTGNEWHVVALADFGGDHKSDILWRSDNGAVALWQMNGSQLASNTGLGTVAPQLHVVGAGDFNGDGKADILWRADDGALSLWQMNGATIQSNQPIGAVGNEWHVDGTGDFNGDGKTDILWRENDGTATLWTMDGAHIPSQQTVAPLPAMPRSACITTISCDGPSLPGRTLFDQPVDPAGPDPHRR